MITDGESHDSADLQNVVEESEKDNITLYGIAVSPSNLTEAQILESRSGGLAGVDTRASLLRPLSHRLTILMRFQVLGYYNRRGINPEAFLREIKYIATDPEEHFFSVTDESALKDIVDALGEKIFSLEGIIEKSHLNTSFKFIIFFYLRRLNN